MRCITPIHPPPHFCERLFIKGLPLVFYLISVISTPPITTKRERQTPGDMHISKSNKKTTQTTYDFLFQHLEITINTSSCIAFFAEKKMRLIYAYFIHFLNVGMLASGQTDLSTYIFNHVTPMLQTTSTMIMITVLDEKFFYKRLKNMYPVVHVVCLRVNPNVSKRTSFTACVLTTDSYLWTVSEREPHLFTVSSLEKIAAVNVISFFFFFFFFYLYRRIFLFYLKSV